MAPRKQIVTLNNASSKGKAIIITGDMVPLLAIDQLHTAENIGSSLPREAAASVQPL